MQVSIVWEAAKVELAAFTKISFVVCACYVNGLTRAKDHRLITGQGHGLLLRTCAAATDSSWCLRGCRRDGFFPLVECCTVHISSAYVDFCRARELEWERARLKKYLEDPILLYEFRWATVRIIHEYVSTKGRRLPTGELSEVMVVLCGATLL